MPNNIDVILDTISQSNINTSDVSVEFTSGDDQFTGQVNLTQNDGTVFTGWNPNDWKYADSLGGAQLYLAANPGGDAAIGAGAGGYYIFAAANNDTNNDGSIDGNGAGVGNADIFTALDNDGSDFGALSGATGAWFRSLRDNKVLNGLGVAGLVSSGFEGGYSNQAVTNNPEIQSQVGIGAADQLLVDFGKETTAAGFQTGLFFSSERVNWSKNADGTYNISTGASSRDREGMTYQLLKSVPIGTSGAIVIGTKTYITVESGPVSVYANGTGSYVQGTPLAGVGNYNGNPGLANVNVRTTGGATFDAILFGGQDYFNGTPTNAGFKPSDVSDYLLNKVWVLDENIVAGQGDDVVMAGDGNDTLSGGPGSGVLYSGSDPDSWVNKGAVLSAHVIGSNTTYVYDGTAATSANRGIFTALDGTGNAANTGSNTTTVNNLINNYGLSGIGVGANGTSTTSLPQPRNPEVQGDANTVAQLQDGDSLTVDFGKLINTASVKLNFFYSNERVQVKNGSTITYEGFNPEQLRYQLYNENGAIGTPQLVTAKNTGAFSTTNIGDFTFVVNSSTKWKSLKLIGENYGVSVNGTAYPDPVIGTPSDVSDYLLNSVNLNTDGNDTLTGGTGADTFSLRGIGGVDQIIDYNPTEDVIQVDKGAFLNAYNIAPTSLSNAQFLSKFTYSNGTLSFDVDGDYSSGNQFNGGRPSIDIANFSGSPLVNPSNFQVV